jgi:hypothetical protein
MALSTGLGASVFAVYGPLTCSYCQHCYARELERCKTCGAPNPFNVQQWR